MIDDNGNGAQALRADLASEEVVLRVLNTDMTGWTLTVPEGTSLLGREPDCRLHLPHHTISRHHCSLRVFPDLIEIADLNSMNGTAVNGALVREAVLKPGDRLRVGEVQLSLEFRARPAASRVRASSVPGLPPGLGSFQFPTPEWAVRPQMETVRYRDAKKTMRFDVTRRDAFRQFIGH